MKEEQREEMSALDALLTTLGFKILHSPWCTSSTRSSTSSTTFSGYFKEIATERGIRMKSAYLRTVKFQNFSPSSPLVKLPLGN